MSISKSCALSALVLLLLLTAQSAMAAAPEAPDRTFAASTSAAGELADGVGVAEYTSIGISEDGRYVAFQSASQNLGEAGPPGVAEAFVKDLQTGAIELVSRADGVGGEAAGEPGITTPEISGDGRFVVFTSAATNLGIALPGEEAGEAHVYRRDLDTGETTLVDRVGGPGGQVLARGAEGNAISADGSVVAFTDRVANLEDPLGDHSETAESIGYVRNLETGVTSTVSRASGAAGELADRGVEGLSLSPDGRFASFYTYATNLGVSGERYEVYLRDLATGATTLLSQNSLGEPADLATYGGNLSGGSGCFGSLASNATNLLEPERSGLVANQTYVFDRCAAPGTIAITSVQEGGALFFFSGAGYAAPTVTADGKESIFAGSTNGSCGCQLYLRDLGAGTTTQVDRASGAAGAVADAEVQYYGISASGCRVAFATRATNLVAEAAPDPGEEPTELYVRQLAPCHEEPKSPPAGGSPTVAPAPTPAGGGPATTVDACHLGPAAVWLVFDGAGRARIRVQKLVGGRHHGWHKVRDLIATAAAAGPLKVAVPALAPGRYRLKLRLQGDPDNPTMTRLLTVSKWGRP